MTRLRQGLVATVAVAGLWARAAGPAAAGDITAMVRDQGNQPVEDAVLLAAPEGRPAAVPEKPGREIVDQINLEFVPHVKPVVVGSPVYFPNKDDVRHHVYSFSPAKRFELPLYSGTPAAPVVLSMMNCWPTSLAMRSPTMRAIRSVGPPAAKGTTMVIGLAG